MDIRSELIKEAAGLVRSKYVALLMDAAERGKGTSPLTLKYYEERLDQEHREAAVRLKKIADDDAMKKLDNATLLVRRLARAMPADSTLKQQAVQWLKKNDSPEILR